VRQRHIVRTCVGLRQFGQAEIQDLDPPVLGYENVLGLQVAVHDSLLVRCRQSVRDLHSIFDRLALRQRPPVQHIAQTLALQQLGNQKRRAAVLPNVEQSQNIGMVQRGNGPRLLLKTMQAVRVLRKRFRENL
jgi:hypothetical protein